MTDEVLADQVRYYRQRASEYDATAYGDLARAGARIARLVAEVRPTGRVLEIACGTGLWTQALAGLADTVTAIDAAPEAVVIARDRVRAGNVTFEIGDVCSWATEEWFDVIFFSAWLSHVPMSRFDQFWQLLRGLLAEGGRVLFIDEHVDVRDKEAYVPAGTTRSLSGDYGMAGSSGSSRTSWTPSYWRTGCVRWVGSVRFGGTGMTGFAARRVLRRSTACVVPPTDLHGAVSRTEIKHAAPACGSDGRSREEQAAR